MNTDKRTASVTALLKEPNTPAQSYESISSKEHAGAPQEEDTEEDQRFGWGSVRPRCLQCMNNLPCFTAWSVVFILAWALCNLSAPIPQFEKQFGLTSKQTAVIGFGSDISGLSVMLFVSYIGTKYNKARGLALGALLFGAGSLFETIPHWKSAAPRFDSGGTSSNVTDGDICPVNASSGNNGSETGSVATDHVSFGIMFVGELIKGLGSTTIFTLGTAYIDENGKYPTSAIFICLTYTATSLGVAASSVLGGWIMDHVYVDFDRVSSKDIPSGPNDPNWIGAWWVIFLGAGLLCFCTCLPLYGYPKYLPGFSPAQKERVDDKKKEKEEGEVELRGGTLAKMMKNIVKDFFRAFLKLVRNVEYLLLSISSAVTKCAGIGMGMFAFKYFTEQYDLSFQVTGYIMAAKAIFSGASFIPGGLIIRRFKLQALGIERLSFVLSICSALASLGMLARCPNTQLSGVQVPYIGQNTTGGLLSPCQGSCECQGQAYNPVCGADDNVYYSPCHAGCRGETKNDTDIIYSNCSCIASHLSPGPEPDHTAHQGLCDTGCYGVFIASPFTFLMTFFAVISVANESIATLRCVDQDLRPFALGVQWIIMRLLGNIPSPIFLGTVLDSTCLVWSDPAPGKGTRYCQVYDKERLAYGFCFMWMVANFVSAGLFLAASCVNMRKKKKKELIEGHCQETSQEPI